MVEPLRHRQTKGAATAMFYLMPPRHISTLPIASVSPSADDFRSTLVNGHRQTAGALPIGYLDTRSGRFAAGPLKLAQHPSDCRSSVGLSCSVKETRLRQLGGHGSQ